MKVVAVRADSYAYAAVEQGLNAILDELGGLDGILSSGDRVLLKPNMLDGLPPDRAVTTHPELVRAVIRAVKRVGAIPIVGDSPGTTGTFKAAKKCGIAAVCREEDVELVAFDSTIEMPCPEGRIMRRFSLARPLAEVDKVISLAKLKTHTFMGITGATKNLFGCVVGMQKAQFHLRMQARREFAAMLLDLANLIKPVLSIVDGVVGMEGNGPRNGRPVHAGVLLGGRNCFAVDVVMTEIMGFKSYKMPLTAMALNQGLTPPLSGIELTGNARDLRLAFAEPNTLLSLSDRIPQWAADLGRSYLTARPIITNECIGCGRCAAHCPPKAMTIANAKVRIDYDKCIRCYCCQEHCPENAVRIEEGALLKLARRLF